MSDTNTAAAQHGGGADGEEAAPAALQHERGRLLQRGGAAGQRGVDDR